MTDPTTEPDEQLVEAVAVVIHDRWCGIEDCGPLMDSEREGARAAIAAVRAWDAVEARVAKGGCPVERRGCDGPGTYYCDEVLWHSDCRRYFEKRREATR